MVRARRARGVGALGRASRTPRRRGGSKGRAARRAWHRASSCACDPAEVRVADRVLRARRGVAGEVEPAFARAGRLVLSNAKNYRMDADVPLVIPEVNAAHLATARRAASQARVDRAASSRTRTARRPWPRWRSRRCTRRSASRRLFVSRCRPSPAPAIPGVPSLDILGNVIPFIGDEEPKIEREMQKMLGTLRRRRGRRRRRSRSARTRTACRSSTATRSACRSASNATATPDEAHRGARATWRGHDGARGPAERAGRAARRHATSRTARSRAATSTPATA